MKNQNKSPETSGSQKLHIPFTERLKTIPEFFGIRLNEEPSYRLVRRDGEIEVREYAPQVVAKITLEGVSFNDFREQAFRHLAAYFFGGNQFSVSMDMGATQIQNEKSTSTTIPMTAPVLEEQEAADRWTMSFVLPAKYDLASAPKPLDPMISLDSTPASKVVVIQYSGTNHERKIEAEEKKLNEWLELHPEFIREGNPVTAQYDGPFVIPFLRKNEIHLKISEVH